MEIYRTVGVSKSYFINSKEIQVIHDCNLKIESGECIMVCGPRNSGKTTLLRILGGLERPTSGTVYFGKQNITGFTDDELAIMRRTRIGYLHHSDNLIPELNVYENIIMPVILSNSSLDEEYYRDLIEHFRLKKLLTNKPKQLSCDQQQAVSYARALINNPDIILVDKSENPWNKLIEQNIMEYLKELVYKLGKTLIMVTEENEFDFFTDRVIRLEHGTVIENQRVS